MYTTASRMRRGTNANNGRAGREGRRRGAADTYCTLTRNWRKSSGAPFPTFRLSLCCLLVCCLEVPELAFPSSFPLTPPLKKLFLLTVPATESKHCQRRQRTSGCFRRLRDVISHLVSSGTRHTGAKRWSTVVAQSKAGHARFPAFACFRRFASACFTLTSDPTLSSPALLPPLPFPPSPSSQDWEHLVMHRNIMWPASPCYSPNLGGVHVDGDNGIKMVAEAFRGIAKTRAPWSMLGTFAVDKSARHARLLMFCEKFALPFSLGYLHALDLNVSEVLESGDIICPPCRLTMPANLCPLACESACHFLGTRKKCPKKCPKKSPKITQNQARQRPQGRE